MVVVAAVEGEQAARAIRQKRPQPHRFLPRTSSAACLPFLHPGLVAEVARLIEDPGIVAVGPILLADHVPFVVVGILVTLGAARSEMERHHRGVGLRPPPPRPRRLPCATEFDLGAVARWMQAWVRL